MQCGASERFSANEIHTQATKAETLVKQGFAGMLVGKTRGIWSKPGSVNRPCATCRNEHPAGPASPSNRPRGRPRLEVIQGGLFD